MNQKKSVLVIDDDEVMRYSARKILEGIGFQVTDFGAARVGLEAARALLPHLVVLDLVMQGVSGFAFLEEARAIQDLSSIPILVLSGLRDKESVSRAIRLGAKDYLTKPLDARLLIQKAAKLVKEPTYCSVDFPKSERPKIQVRVPGTILQGNEAGFLLETAIKIAPRAPVNVRSSLLDEFGCTSLVLRKTDTPGRSGFPGQYLNDIAAIGLDPISVSRIRRAIRGWS